MEAKLLQNIQTCSWLNTEKVLVSPGRSVWMPHRTMGKGGTNLLVCAGPKSRTSVHCKSPALKVFSSLKESTGSVLELGDLPVSVDESLILKNKSVQIEPYLSGRCIYLVGMMGSGKTTIGKVLAKALGYSFFDIDTQLEKNENMTVAEIFKKYGEGFFRNKETEVLEKVSMLNHLVVSTGGGAVVRPINWKHMRSGISVWLDVPLECLARRISAVGTGTRPLLDGDGEDEYTKALNRLSKLWEDRLEAYANANARVSLEYIATKKGYQSADELGPAVIAIEVLEQIQSFLKDDGFAI